MAIDNVWAGDVGVFPRSVGFYVYFLKASIDIYVVIVEVFCSPSPSANSEEDASVRIPDSSVKLESHHLQEGVVLNGLQSSSVCKTKRISSIIIPSSILETLSIWEPRCIYRPQQSYIVFYNDCRLRTEGVTMTSSLCKAQKSLLFNGDPERGRNTWVH